MSTSTGLTELQLRWLKRATRTESPVRYWNLPHAIIYTLGRCQGLRRRDWRNFSYGGWNVPHGRNRKYGGWNLWHAIIYSWQLSRSTSTGLTELQLRCLKRATRTEIQLRRWNVPHRRNLKYGDWNLPHGIIYTLGSYQGLRQLDWRNFSDGGWSMPHGRKYNYGGWSVPHGRKYNYGGWNLPQDNLHTSCSCQGLRRRDWWNFSYGGCYMPHRLDCKNIFRYLLLGANPI